VPNYTYPGIDPLNAAVKNKLGIQTHDDFEIVSAPLVAARATEIAEGQGPAGNFDAEHLKAIHQHLFQDVFEWAGHSRDEVIRLSDGTTATELSLRKVDGTPFLPGPRIQGELQRIFDTLRDSGKLRGLSREVFAEQAADIMGEINGVHPFREGNGRTQRVFMRELAKQVGHELNFSVVTRERMIQASVAANDHGDSTMMRRMFNEIGDPVRVAALEKALGDLRGLNFPVHDHYLATAEPGHKIEVTMAGIAGDQFMARTNTAILIAQTSDLPTPSPQRGDVFTLEPSHWGRAGNAKDRSEQQAQPRNTPGGRPRGRGGR